MLLNSEKRFSEDGRRLALWEELGAGAPTLTALAEICCRALIDSPPPPPMELLPLEAQAILYAARHRGVLEVKGSNSAFDSAERMLAVCVELDHDNQLVFRRRGDPEWGIRCLESFRALCQTGMMMHHIFHDFSLSEQGFITAREVEDPQVVKMVGKMIQEQAPDWEAPASL